MSEACRQCGCDCLPIVHLGFCSYCDEMGYCYRDDPEEDDE